MGEGGILHNGRMRDFAEWAGNSRAVLCID